MTEEKIENRLGPVLRVEPVRLGTIATLDIENMAAAGARVAEHERALAAAGTNVVATVLGGSDEFFEWDHYPPGDIYDWDSHAQFYYHAHPPENRRDVVADEHGHFHTFLRLRGMPTGVAPVADPGLQPPTDPGDVLTHFVAISMGRTSQAIRLFTTNRWVTGETWYAAEDVIAMLPRFVIGRKHPNDHVNEWITAVLTLFRPDIERLLRRRDEVLGHRAADRPGINVYEDRSLEVASFTDVSVEERISAVAAELRAR